MTDEPLDDLDRRILHLLQVDARRLSDTDIAAETGVTSTTIGNRIRRLEGKGIIRGYRPEIDYELAGFPLVVLFVGGVPVAERSAVAERALDVAGVVDVRETVSGETNLYVKAVAESTSDIERIARRLDGTGVRVAKMDIISEERTTPWNYFGRDSPDRYGEPVAPGDDPPEE